MKGYDPKRHGELRYVSHIGEGHRYRKGETSPRLGPACPEGLGLHETLRSLADLLRAWWARLFQRTTLSAILEDVGTNERASTASEGSVGAQVAWREADQDTMRPETEADEQLEVALRLAQNPNTPEEVLFKIGTHREWTKSRAVVLALLKNPNTPFFIRLTIRLTMGVNLGPKHVTAARANRFLPRKPSDDEGGGGTPAPVFAGDTSYSDVLREVRDPRTPIGAAMTLVSRLKPR